LGPLTLGDFATIRRRATLLDQPLTPEMLLAALAEEAELRRQMEE